MAKIKISDLPKERKVSQKEMDKVVGGVLVGRYSLFQPAPRFGPGIRSSDEWDEEVEPRTGFKK